MTLSCSQVSAVCLKYRCPLNDRPLIRHHTISGHTYSIYRHNQNSDTKHLMLLLRQVFMTGQLQSTCAFKLAALSCISVNCQCMTSGWHQKSHSTCLVLLHRSVWKSNKVAKVAVPRWHHQTKTMARHFAIYQEMCVPRRGQWYFLHQNCLTRVVWRLFKSKQFKLRQSSGLSKCHWHQLIVCTPRLNVSNLMQHTLTSEKFNLCRPFGKVKLQYIILGSTSYWAITTTTKEPFY